MFASLDSADVILPPVDGRARYVQTDGRTTEEIARDLHLSALFAIVRVKNPLRFVEANAPAPIVRYAAVHFVPHLVHEAVIAAGGELGTREGTTVAYAGGSARPLDAILAEAMKGLAAAVVKERGTELTREGLGVLEASLVTSNVPSPKDDPFAHWRAVFQLGAVAGELIRRAVGGKWTTTTQKTGTVPIILRAPVHGEEKTVNPFGKAKKVLTPTAMKAGDANASSSDALPTVCALVDVVIAAK